MREQYLVGIDIGSSFTKSSIYSVNGRLLGAVKRDTRPHQPSPGIAEHDPEMILQAVIESVWELMETTAVSPANIAAICLDGMQSGVLGIDADCNPTTSFTTTLDLRFTPYLNHVLDQHHDLIRSITGSGQPTIAPKIMWIRDAFPDAYRRTVKFATISGYLLAKLAGLSAAEIFMDITYLWVTGLSDTQNYAWSDDLCQAMDIPLEKLPRIVNSSDIVGRLIPAMAKATGLSTGTPIVAGMADQVAGFIGAGVTQPNRMADNAGTYPTIAFCTDTFQPDMKNRVTEVLPSPIPGYWNPCAYIIGGGLTHHWFKENFAFADEIVAQEMGKSSAYAVLDEMAASLPPGSEKLFFIPHLGGRASPNNTNYRGAWFGFSWTHKREHFYRAILEAVAYDQYLMYQSFQEIYPEADVAEITAYGGGSQSALWNQIKANVMGVPYVCLGRDDVAAVGNAILAGYALGIFDDMTVTSERFMQRSTRYEPDPAAHDLYCQYAAFYAELLDCTEPAYAELAVLP